MKLTSCNFVPYHRYNSLLCKDIPEHYYLSDLEVLYLQKKLDFVPFKLIYVVLNKDLSKTCCLLVDGINILKLVDIPALEVYYKDEDINNFYTQVTFKKMNGEVIKKLYLGYSKIKKGEVNRYGWKCIKIERNVPIKVGTRQVFDFCALDFD